MVPVITVTVLAFSASLASVDPGWNIACRVRLAFGGSSIASWALAATP